MKPTQRSFMKKIKLLSIHDEKGRLFGYRCPKCAEHYLQRVEKCKCGAEFIENELKKGAENGK